MGLGESRTDTYDSVMTEQVRVCFEGEGSGVGELTWVSTTSGRLCSPRARRSASAGYYLCRRALRSRTSRPTCGSSRGGTRPYARGSGSMTTAARARCSRVPEIPLEVIDADDAEPAQAAAALHRRWDETVFDYAGEWPIRWGVTVSRGAVTHPVSVICHLAADGAGVLALLADLNGRDPVTGLAKGPVRAIQPLEQARLQATPSALRQSDVALRYCERLLRTIPARRFPDSADPRRPRFWQVFLNSPGQRAVRILRRHPPRVARRHGVMRARAGNRSRGRGPRPGRSHRRH